MTDVVVIGAGIAGLTAALRLARAGRAVTLVSFGTGGLVLGQGTVDVLGYAPDRVRRPLDALAGWVADHPDHPYATLGPDAVRDGVAFLADAVGPDLLVGDPEQNVWLPTAVGAVRPTCLVQPSMAAGAVVDGARFVVVGLQQLKDFTPSLCAANLARTDVASVSARAVTLDLPAQPGHADSSALAYARAFDSPSFRTRFVAALRPQLADGETVLVPAVLGVRDPDAWKAVADALGRPVAEVPLPPPSVPGMRLDARLLAAVRATGVRVISGSRVTAAQTSGGRVQSVTLATTGRDRTLTASAFVYAPGGIESGALHLDSYGRLTERVFDLPLRAASELVTADDPTRQELFRAGVATDDRMRPVDADGEVVYANLHVAGGLLAGALRWNEKSGEGIALGSALRAADSIGEDLA